jgi:hypothetical protein
MPSQKMMTAISTSISVNPADRSAPRLIREEETAASLRDQRRARRVVPRVQRAPPRHCAGHGSSVHYVPLVALEPDERRSDSHALAWLLQMCVASTRPAPCASHGIYSSSLLPRTRHPHPGRPSIAAMTERA